MGWQADLTNMARHLLHGDLSGALSDAGQTAQDVTNSAAGAAANAAGAAVGFAQGVQASLSGMGQTGVTVNPPSITVTPATRQPGPCGNSAVIVPPPQSMSGGTGPGCCDRFSFNSGFLVDGVTGRVWQYNQRSKSFEEVPVVNTQAKQDIVNSMVENKLSAIRAKYEAEQLGTVAPNARAKHLGQFEKEYLDPLRSAAQAITY